jgi:hypothetical protein
MDPTKMEAKYSGPSRSGICVCGHSWESHHRMIVMNKEYYETTQEGYVLGECCFYGFNEAGGLMPDDNGEWHPHCFGYRDSLDTTSNQ